ncbi:MAG: dihydrofolate reductase [Anaerolineales bacterium]
MIVSIIAAFAAGNRAIGRHGGIPWHLPADLARFKQTTMGHHLVLGRRTYESLRGSALPGRTMLVLSRNPATLVAAHVTLYPNLHAAVAHAERAGEDELFIGGGEAVYRAALEIAVRMYLTIVHADVDGDAFFPAFEARAWSAAEEVYRPADAANPHAMTFRTLHRMR